MNVGDTLYAISEAELSLKTSMTEDTLKVYPAENLTPELAAAIKEHKPEIIKIVSIPLQHVRRTLARCFLRC